jgi:hypothetical protein
MILADTLHYLGLEFGLSHLTSMAITLWLSKVQIFPHFLSRFVKIDYCLPDFLLHVYCTYIKICTFDSHNVIAIEVKCERPNSRPKYSKRRSFNNFDEQNFLCDLDNINWDIDPNSDINSQ